MAKSDNSRGKKPSKNFKGGDRKKPFNKNFSSRPKQNTPQKKSNPDEIRLNRYIANAGICSRREADTYIAAGNVTVNGKTITEMGYKVKRSDDVRFDGKRLNLEKKEYILLNKPKNFITTTSDEKGRRTVMELISSASNNRLLPVGRLDRNTTGLLLFTNDGDLTKKLTHPKHNVRKIYHVHLDNNLSLGDLHKIEEGLELEDGPISVDSISYIQGAPKREVGVEIHSGRNRIVRRIFEHLGYNVTKLDRVIFAGLTKKDLPRGHWRHLTEQEVINLKMIK
ncbi:MAG: pseudouridine synthase [Bacteroidota bacterium]|uniref:Pseudouridine synthase n=1 Tax=Flagellimonas profundi TaxID=2915620 RepID=A0ABS3FJH8_9FLAO|nr:pseudouridine synthase [Allomuricauda profundi]MBO0343208.1 rRNA pseudouridine synthase [Allomuricauda profundi]MEC7770440.1 pseudouridine synthase [Bacteroidota bacterium]